MAPIPNNGTTSGDRTHVVPRHVGRNIFPASPFFNRLVRFASAMPSRLCIRDANTGVEATHLQVLTAALAFRERLRENLTTSVRQDLEEGKEVYVAILAPGGYEYTIAVIAALALGAAIVPMTVALPAEEAVYFATKSRSVAVLCAQDSLPLGVQLEKLIKNSDARSTFTCIPIHPSLHQPLLKPTDIKVSSDAYLPDNSPGVVIFTSGTSGPPKGAVMRRGFIHDTALAVADHYDLGPRDTMLHLLPVHHATGIGINFFPCLISGCVIEFKSGSFSAEWTWERFRRGGRYFESTLSALPQGEVDEYISGARSLKACLCGTSALPTPISDFWTQILGKRILLRYGASEIGAVFKAHPSDPNVPDGSVGTIFPGCDVQLRDADTGECGVDEGEVVVRSPAGELLSKYIFDPEATAAAHTAEGYYRTGDIARREGEYYFILGRASIDIIKSGGYKLSALDIEREILGLEYVAEVMVVGVPDLEFGERVGAAVVLKDTKDQRGEVVQKSEFTIEKLRSDLRSRLAGYKMPTLLRIIEGELPKSGTGKVVKKILGPQFFPKNYAELGEVMSWRPGQKAKL